ncbi:phosphotriesterase [Streptomyces sp. 796.1]|uniref:phosphotriesterase family protein n=1 Tax=Streptomyces sp. 796.1 TaxID=3163029 RepID=UPI0039C9E0FB
MSTTDSTAGAAGAPRPGPSSGGSVTTVTGEVSPDALGLVLPHEHLLSDFAPPADTAESWAAAGHPRPAAAGPRRLYHAPLTMDLLGDLTLGAANRDNWLLDDERVAVAEATAFRAAGGGTLVDATPAGLGRQPAALRRIAEASGVHLVMGTGRHHPGRPADPTSTTRHASPGVDELTEEFVRDLTEGVAGVRAGLIGQLAALDPEQPAARTLLVAAARAAAATGAPLALTRSADSVTQARVLDLLAASGADLGRVAVGGCDALAPRPDDLEPLLARGVFLQFDRLGRLPSVHSVSDDQDVAAAVVELARRGHADRILLSHGTHTKAQLLAYGGGGYGFLLQQFLPYLRMVGADDALIERVTVHNPARLLTIAHRRADA